jgi:hypothetical protein
MPKVALGAQANTRGKTIAERLWRSILRSAPHSNSFEVLGEQTSSTVVGRQLEGATPWEAKRPIRICTRCSSWSIK